MAKKLTITNTRPTYQTLWYFQTNPPQNIVLNEWLETNKDKVTFQFDMLMGGETQVLQYTFADEATAEEFSAFVTSGNLGGAMEEYHASAGITSTIAVTDV